MTKPIKSPIDFYPVHNTQCVQPDKLNATVCTFVLLTCNDIKNHTTMRCQVGKKHLLLTKGVFNPKPKALEEGGLTPKLIFADFVKHKK